MCNTYIVFKFLCTQTKFIIQTLAIKSRLEQWINHQPTRSVSQAHNWGLKHIYGHQICTIPVCWQWRPPGSVWWWGRRLPSSNDHLRCTAIQEVEEAGPNVQQSDKGTTLHIWVSFKMSRFPHIHPFNHPPTHSLTPPLTPPSCQPHSTPPYPSLTLPHPSLLHHLIAHTPSPLSYTTS